MSQKFFEIIPEGTKIDFIGKSRAVLIVSLTLIVVALGFLATKGLNYGVDFVGGTEIHVRFKDKPTADEVRAALAPIGYSDAMVQGFGDAGSGEYLVRVRPEDLQLDRYQTRIEDALNPLNTKGKPVQVKFREERIYVTFDQGVSPKDIEEALKKVSVEELTVDTVTLFGTSSGNEYLVQFAGAATRISRAFAKEFGKGKFEVLQIDEVGAKVGSELRMQAVGAVLIAILFILIYIWFRFDFEFAPGAVMALVHDSLVVLGIFSLFDLQFDLPIVAAVLTIVGYSINDTIVLYDRVRENIKRTREPDLVRVINLSINQTLSRTILTSGTALMASGALLVLGGPITYNFALAFTIGIVIGTYSSVFVASPITVSLHHYLQKRHKSAA